MFGSFSNIIQTIETSGRDEDLYYYGDDPIVWDRVNNERLRRGLGPLPNPRPEDPDAPGTLTSPPGGQSREDLRQLEARREQLITQTSTLQEVNFVNQLTLARKRTELINISDPQQRAAVQAQINNLGSTIDTNQRRLAPLNQQLTQVDQQVAAATQQVFPGFPGIPSLPEISPATGALDKLKAVPVSSPVDAANVLKQIAATVKIPGLDTSQVTGLMGSIAKVTDQDIGTVSASGGIGKFGITPDQLEQQGYIKPGSVSAFVGSAGAPETTEQDLFEAERINSQGGDITPEQVASNRQLNTILSSPFLWTGKGGVSGLGNFTSNETLQSLAQQDVLGQGYESLKQLGVINGSETAAQLGSLVQTASKFGGAATADWAKGQSPPDLESQINNIAKDGQFAVNFVDTKIPTLGALPFRVEGEVATVDRTKVDAAFNSILSNPKIPLPSFGAAGIGSIAFDLYSGSKDEDLTYGGDDYIVWDNVNAERLRRGLPGLDAIGIPRPPEDPAASGPNGGINT